MKKFEKTIPIFFSSDKNYLPYLAVAIQSIKESANDSYFYDIKILCEGFDKEFDRAVKKYRAKNVGVSFCDVSGKIKEIKDDLRVSLRDYYTVSIFYRMFIASLFPTLDKAIYIDCDIVLVSDIADLYEKDVDGYVLGACTDQVVSVHEAFKVYVENALGIKQTQYFNSGVLLMNLKEYRAQKIEQKFLYLLKKYNLESVAPDQDYLNVLCKDRVLYLDAGFDRMPTEHPADYPIYLIHYNMFNKPWLYDNVRYGEYFWKYAKNTEFYRTLKNMQKNYPDEKKAADLKAGKILLDNSFKIAEYDKTFKTVMESEKL